MLLSNLPYRLNANIDSTFSGFKLLFGILLWRNVYSCFILPTSQMLSYTSMMGLINYTTTVWVEHDFALISILLLDFILPFLVVSEENLPTTWCRISPRFKRKKKKLISIAKGGWNARSANCISYRYFQKIMSQWNEEEKSLISFSVS